MLGWASWVALVVKTLPANAGSPALEDAGSIPGLGRSPGEGNGNPLQCSCLEIPHGQRSLAGCSPWGRKESDRTERQHARTLLIWDLGTRFTCVHFRTFKLSEIKFQRAREVIFPEGGHMASTWPQGASGPRWPVQPSTG